MKLVHKRCPDVERFLNRGFIELSNIQSYLPEECELDKITKWTCFKLKKYLKRVTNWKSNNLSGEVEDENGILIKNYKFHVKLIPILDPYFVMRNGYPESSSNIWLPENIYKFNTLCEKLYSKRNSAYIDVKCAILLGLLQENDLTPHFNSVIGIYSGITEDFKQEFTEEYHEYKNKKWFNKALKKKRIRITLDEKELNVNKVTSLKRCNLDEFVDEKISINSSLIRRDDEYIDDITVIHKRMPVQVVITDRLDDTFVNLINKDAQLCRQKTLFNRLNTIRKKLFFDKLSSWIFQICAGLSIANNAIDFVHNDLHVQNVMGNKTNDKYIFYKYNEIIYRIPTYNYVMRIIDFGRSTYKLNDTIFMGDVFDEDNEAGGQYKRKNKRTLRPSPSFDLPRFAISFLEDLDEKWPSEHDLASSEIGKLLYDWCIDDNGFDILRGIDGFDLYIHISRYFRKREPRGEIKNTVFDKYIFTDEIPESQKVYDI